MSKPHKYDSPTGRQSANHFYEIVFFKFHFYPV
jgi:hypothetical protein